LFNIFKTSILLLTSDKRFLSIKSKYNSPRFNGQKIIFDSNGCILINKINFKNKKTRNKLTLVGSNVFGIVLKEFRLYSIKININAINII